MGRLLQHEQRPTANLQILRRDLAGSLNWLSKTFQTNFQIWEWNSRWFLASASGSAARPDQEILIHQHIDQFHSPPRYQFEAVNETQAIVAIPVDTGSTRQQLAVGVVPAACREHFPATLKLLLKQKHQGRIVVEQHRLLEQYASYASLDFEELSWFGSLVENVAFKEFDYELTSSARQALNGLKEFVQAESLSVVLCDPSPDAPREVIKRIFSLGTRDLKPELVNRLLKLAGPNAFCESYINNFVDSEVEFQTGEIRSVVVIPALCNHRCFGWLIAINRQESGQMNETPWDSGIYLKANFSTKAALLMESAASVLATHAHNLSLMNEQQALLIGTVRSLVNTLDAKDKYTCGHSDRVALIAKCIAREYGLSEQECQRIYLAGLLHDIGKIGVRDEVLMKVGPLTPDEFAEIKLHPVFGYEILKHLGQLQHVLPGVMHHHEAWNGTGYPNGLKKDEIPVAARILAVADAYDAMTSDRPYRKGISLQKAESILRKGAGTQWAPAVVSAFFEVIDEVHAIIANKEKRSYLPVNKSDYVFEEDVVDEEDMVLSAIMTTTALSENRLYSGLN